MKVLINNSIILDYDDYNNYLITRISTRTLNRLVIKFIGDKDTKAYLSDTRQLYRYNKTSGRFEPRFSGYNHLIEFLPTPIRTIIGV